MPSDDLPAEVGQSVELFLAAVDNLTLFAIAIAIALFAAFVVGGILAKAVPLWLVLCSVS